MYFSAVQKRLLCDADGGYDADQGTTAAKSSAHSANAVPSTSSASASKSSTLEKKPKTIQDDPQATEVFKSLFNTHKTAKQQQQAHWVTYNPQYF